MSEVLKKRLKDSIGNEITIFLNNGFHFEGKITNCDDFYLEILDYRTKSYKILKIGDIADAQVKPKEAGNEKL